MKDLKGKSMLITGGASGIGKALAHRFLREGARVALADINVVELERTRGEYAELGELVAFPCDIRHPRSIRELAGSIGERFGDIDILVNNAGILDAAFFLDKTEEIIERTAAVNFLAQCWTVKAFLPAMIERKSGLIVNIASTAAVMSTPYTIDYCATKHAVMGLTKGLRREARLRGQKGVGFLYVCPSIVDTGMVKGLKCVPWMKPLTPEAVAEKTVSAIKKEKPSLFIPASARLLPIAESILPASVIDLLYQASGFSACMQPVAQTSSLPAKGREPSRRELSKREVE